MRNWHRELNWVEDWIFGKSAESLWYKIMFLRTLAILLGICGGCVSFANGSRVVIRGRSIVGDGTNFTFIIL
jgi:hypothetical protein